MLVLEGASLALRFGMQVGLARLSSVTAYGVYAYGISTSQLLAVPAGMGLPSVALRVIPDYQARNERGLLAGFVFRSISVTFLAGVILAGLAVGVAAATHAWHHDASAFCIAMALVPLSAVMTLQGESLRAARKLVAGRIIPTTVYPSGVLLAGLALYVINGGRLSPSILLLCAVATTVVGIVLQHIFTIRSGWRAADRAYEPRRWAAIARPLFGVKVAQMVLNQSDIFLVGLLMGAKQAGIYAAASKTAVLGSFFLSASNLAVVPEVAAAYARDDHRELTRSLRTGAKVAFFPSLVLSVGVAVFGTFVLGVFGPEFREGAVVLAILVGGRLANAATGPVGAALNVTNFARESQRIYVAGAIYQTVMAFILIKILGTVGAAVAAGSGMVLLNVALYMSVTRLLSVRLWPRSLDSADTAA